MIAFKGFLRPLNVYSTISTKWKITVKNVGSDMRWSTTLTIPTVYTVSEQYQQFTRFLNDTNSLHGFGTIPTVYTVSERYQQFTWFLNDTNSLHGFWAIPTVYTVSEWYQQFTRFLNDTNSLHGFLTIPTVYTVSVLTALDLYYFVALYK